MKRIIIILLTLLVFSSCAQHDKVRRDDRSVTFSLFHSEDPSQASRAAGVAEYNENKVTKLDIFFFSTTDVCLAYPEQSQIYISGNDVTVKFTGEEADRLIGEDIELYILVNCNLPRSSMLGKSKQELTELVHENAATFNTPGFSVQQDFLMEGSLDITISNGFHAQLGTVTLYRAAAKIEVTIMNASISGYEAVTASVSMYNYLDKTFTGSEAGNYPPVQADLKSAEGRPLKIPGGPQGITDTPFYTYANDWESDRSRETYIVIAVDWLKLEDSSVKTYYYRIPFDYTPESPDDDHNFCIRRNYIYDFAVNISALGSLDPEEIIELEPYFELRDWTTQEIEVRLVPYAFLFVEERRVTMNNITSYEIAYTSSHPVSIEDITAKFNMYISTGEVIDAQHQPGEAGYPSVVVDEQNTVINIISPVPINYVPVVIEFKVINEVGLYQNVSVTQYPRQYITAQFSTGGMGGYTPGSNYPNGSGSQKNFNFFTINTNSVSPYDGYVIGDPTELVNGIYQTKTDEMSNKLLSPSFVVATHRGITQPTTYSQAQQRCRTYYESQYPAGSWRIPTQAEMQLLADIQNDWLSAISKLFDSDHTGTAWWTARQYNAMEVGTGTVVSGSATTGNSIRCVHDVWKD